MHLRPIRPLIVKRFKVVRVVTNDPFIMKMSVGSMNDRNCRRKCSLPFFSNYQSGCSKIMSNNSSIFSSANWGAGFIRIPEILEINEKTAF